MIPMYRIVEMLVYSLLNFLPYMTLALTPFRSRFRFSNSVTWLLVGGVTVVQIGLGALAGLFPGGNVGIISAASTLIYFGFYFIAVRVHVGKTLFILLMLSNIANFVVMCSKCLEGQICPEYAMQDYRWTFSAVMAVVEIVFLIPLYFYMRRMFTAALEKDTANATWRLLWMIPATFYVIWYYHLYGSKMSSLELALQPSNAVFLLIINLGAMLVYHMVARLILILDVNAELSEKNHALAMQNLQYVKLQDKITEARQARHDIRHHISIMESYLREKEYDKLSNYLAGYRKSLPDNSTIHFCDNRAANILFLHFADQAQAAGVHFSVQASLPDRFPIPESDLSVLLGNLLENAMDACRSQINEPRKVMVKASTDNGALFLLIDNTYSGTVRQDRNGRYLTTKKHGTGLGLSSVRSIVERYEGSLRISHEDHMFCVSIMLNLPMEE